MGTARPRATASAAARVAPSPAWLPTLDRRPLDEPSPEHAHTWQTTDGRTLFGRRNDDGWSLWSPTVAVFSFGREGPVAYDCADDDAAQRLWRRSALPLALEARGLPVLHAGAVCSSDAVVAFCGRSTAGKSTLAAACVAAGIDVVADDALALSVGSGSVEALTVPFELNPRPATSAVLGTAAGAGGAAFRLRALVLLEPDETTTKPRLEQVEAAEAFGALMPHVYCFSLDDSRTRLVAEYTAVVERVPTRRLRYRREHESLPAMIDAVRTLLGH